MNTVHSINFSSDYNQECMKFFMLETKRFKFETFPTRLGIIYYLYLFHKHDTVNKLLNAWLF